VVVSLGMSPAPILEVHEREPPPGWREAVDATEGGVFHTLGWARHRCHGGQGEPLFCDWRDGATGAVVARAIAIRRPGRDSLVGRLAARVLIDSTPLSQANGLDFVSGLTDWARRRPAVLDVSLGSYDARREWRPGGPPAAVHRCEFVVEHGDPEAVTAAVKGDSIRSNLRKAERAGVEVRRAAVADLPLFAELYGETLRGLEQRKGVAAPQLARGRFAASLAPMLESGHGRVYLAYRSDGTPEAGWLFAVSRGGAYAVYSGAAPSARSTGSSSLALVEAMRDLVADGLGRINLGGTPASARDPDSSDHGLYKFKLRFGARVEERVSGNLMVRPGRAAAIKRLRRLARR
jgi:Acetyltransferase (GNAT) domain